MKLKNPEETGALLPDPLPPLDDWVAKELFLPKENHNLLAAFLKQFLCLPEEEYENIQVADPQLQRKAEDDKLGILDMRFITKSGCHINLELQAKRDPDMMERMLAYMSHMIYDQLSKGDRYNMLRKAIGVYILGFNLFSTKEFHSVGKITDASGGFHWTKLWEAHVIELKKMPQDGTPSGKIHWLQFFNIKTWEDVAMVARLDEIMEAATDRLKELSSNPDVRRRYYRELHARRVRKAELESEKEAARAEGLAEGRAEGLSEARRQTVVNMLKFNEPVEKIASYTELSIEFIQQISKELLE